MVATPALDALTRRCFAILRHFGDSNFHPTIPFLVGGSLQAHENPVPTIGYPGLESVIRALCKGLDGSAYIELCPSVAYNWVAHYLPCKATYKVVVAPGLSVHPRLLNDRGSEPPSPELVAKQLWDEVGVYVVEQRYSFDNAKGQFGPFSPSDTREIRRALQATWVESHAPR